MDIIEESKMSYDEKFKLIKRARLTVGSITTVTLELRQKTYGIKFYLVISGMITSKVFLTQFFANRYFNKLVKKYEMKE
jgi:hypothetical protein